MIRAMFLWIIVPLLMTPVAVAFDDPPLQDLTVDELWTKSNRGSDAAYKRLLELGPEARVLAQRILHPKGEVFHKWPGRIEAELIEAMWADAVPELIAALRHSVDDEDRIHFLNQLESLGRMARPAGDVLMTIALEEDGAEREAALKALAAAQTKKDFLIPEAIPPTVGAMYLAGEDCVVQGDLVILVGIKHGEKAAVQSRRSDVSQKTRSGGGGGELRL